MNWLPALITGAASLLGGAADRAQANRNYQRNDLIKTMKDAQEAGFHPLEALRAGYTQSQIAQAPRISSMGVAANAVDAAASMYRDTLAQDKQNALIDAQIANIEADTRRMGSIATYSGSMPRIGSSNVPQRNVDIYGNPQTSGFQTSKEAGFEADPDVSDQEVLETRYGDVVGAIGGLGILGRDIGYNMYRRAPEFWQGVASVGNRVIEFGNQEVRSPRIGAASVGDFNYRDETGGYIATGGTTR